MQVQSSTEPPKKLAQGERPIMADGNEYNLFTLKESGSPLEIVYPSEGTPFDRRQRRRDDGRAASERGAALQSFLFYARGASSS